MKPMQLQTIVVPLDGSTLAEHALPVALRLLPTDNAQMILVRVPVYAEAQAPVAAEYSMFWPEIRDAPGSYRQVYQEAVDYLTHLAKRSEHAGLTVEVRVEEGDRAGAIVDVAVEKRADLIVMTTHGRTGVTRWIIGSITERVLHEAPCPVLAVRARPESRPGQSGAMFAQKILVPLDGSELAEQAIPPALAVARQTGGELILLRVAAVGPEELDLVEGEAASDFALATEYLERTAADCRAQGIATTARTVPSGGAGAGNIATAIIEDATASGIDLIAMSTHGRSGLRRWVYGSVTEKVLHNADIDLLIVRP